VRGAAAQQRERETQEEVAPCRVVTGETGAPAGRTTMGVCAMAIQAGSGAGTWGRTSSRSTRRPGARQRGVCRGDAEDRPPEDRPRPALKARPKRRQPPGGRSPIPGADGLADRSPCTPPSRPGYDGNVTRMLECVSLARATAPDWRQPCQAHPLIRIRTAPRPTAMRAGARGGRSAKPYTTARLLIARHAGTAETAPPRRWRKRKRPATPAATTLGGDIRRGSRAPGVSGTDR
jgi:hypothetical protein